MKLRILFVLIIFSFFNKTFAQTITGTVIDASNNNPLSGANISFGSKGGTVTDHNGTFSIPCGKTNRITVSYVGYEVYEHTIKNCNEHIRIRLVPSSNKLNVVEITATSNQNRSILYQPVSVDKLQETELKRNTGLFLDDAINANIPGVTMQRRAVSSGQQINIRGYGNGVRGTNGPSSNFDIQGTKVYLNGIPLTDAEGITILDDIDFASIGNVEVVKGPAGSLYGLAIAGAVNLRTIKPEKGKTTLAQDVMFGSNGLRRYTTHFQMGGDRSSLFVNYGHQKADGYMTHTASHKNFVNIAGDFQPSEKQTINAYFGYSNSYDERGGELTITQYNNRDYSGNPDYIKRNAHSEVISFRAGLTHTYNFNSHISNSTTVFGSGVTNNSSSAGGWTDKDPVNYGLRSTLNFNFGLSDNISLSGIAGVEAQAQRAQIVGYNMVANPADATAYWIIGAARSNQFTYSGTSSTFTEWTLAMPHDLSVTAGLGYSRMKIQLNDRFYVANSTLPTRYDTSYTGMYSPHVAINKVFNKQVSLYASYSRGYKAPVSSYFFIPTTGKLNAGLKPEVGDQFEIGTKGTLVNSKLTYELALFKILFKDKMYGQPVPLNSTTTAYTYIANGGNEDNKGVEAMVRYTAYQSATSFFKTVRPFANFTYSDFKYEDYKFRKGSTNELIDYSGYDVAGVPKYVANVGFDIATKPGLYANATYMYRDKVSITSNATEFATSYNLLNAKIGFERSLSNHFDLDVFFGAQNITNAQYPLMVFVNQLPDAYLPAPLYANFYAGVNLKYNF
jgi:iron complex outermembrane recepter protein